jgi:hypothetical protein
VVGLSRTKVFKELVGFFVIRLNREKRTKGEILTQDVYPTGAYPSFFTFGKKRLTQGLISELNIYVPNDGTIIKEVVWFKISKCGTKKFIYEF